MLSKCHLSSPNIPSLIIFTNGKIILFIFESQLSYCSFHLFAILYTKSYCIYRKIVLISKCHLSSPYISSLIVFTNGKIIMSFFENQLSYCCFHLFAILYTKSYCIYKKFVFIRKKIHACVCCILLIFFCLFSKLGFIFKRRYRIFSVIYIKLLEVQTVINCLVKLF